MKSTDENGVSPGQGREGGIAHMVRYGFIHTKEDIKFLVLFAMLLPEHAAHLCKCVRRAAGTLQRP